MATLHKTSKMRSDPEVIKPYKSIGEDSVGSYACPFCKNKPIFRPCSDPAIIALVHTCDMVSYCKVVFTSEKKIAVDDWNGQLAKAKEVLESIC